MAKTKKTADPKKTVITMLIDESGSMQALFQPTCDGFNEYVTTVSKKLSKDNTYFSAIKFDSNGIRKLQVGTPIAQAVHLSSENYRPNGMTPLLDAIGKAIAATDEVVAKEKAENVIMVVQTDGHENCSVEYNLQSIKQLVENRTGQGWQFVFMGAGINAFEDATKMGFSGAATMSYGRDAGATRAMFGATASNTAFYATGMSANMNYTAAQSKAAGEDVDITRAKLNLTED